MVLITFVAGLQKVSCQILSAELSMVSEFSHHYAAVIVATLKKKSSLCLKLYGQFLWINPVEKKTEWLVLERQGHQWPFTYCYVWITTGRCLWQITSRWLQVLSAARRNAARRWLMTALGVNNGWVNRKLPQTLRCIFFQKQWIPCVLLNM